MAHFGTKIIEWRMQRGWSQADLAERAVDPNPRKNTENKGVSRQTIGAIESRRTTNGISAGTLRGLAAAFGVSPEQLVRAVEQDAQSPSPLTGKRPDFHGGRDIAGGSLSPAKRRIPLHGEAPANMGTNTIGVEVEATTENLGRHVEASLPAELFLRDPCAGAAWVRGDSMAPEFQNGDIVVYSPSLESQVANGDVCCVHFTQEAGGGSTLKRIMLLPDKKHIVLSGSDPSQTRVAKLSDIAQCYPVVVHIRNLHPRRQPPWDYSVPPKDDMFDAGSAIDATMPAQPFPDYDNS